MSLRRRILEARGELAAAEATFDMATATARRLVSLVPPSRLRYTDDEIDRAWERARFGIERPAR
jgi:hypothetical protein